MSCYKNKAIRLIVVFLVVTLLISKMTAYTVAISAVAHGTDSDEGYYNGYYYSNHLYAEAAYASASTSYGNLATIKTRIEVHYGSPYINYVYFTKSYSATEENAHFCRATWYNSEAVLALYICSYHYINGGMFAPNLYVYTGDFQ